MDLRVWFYFTVVNGTFTGSSTDRGKVESNACLRKALLSNQLTTLITGLIQARDLKVFLKNNYLSLTCLLFLRILNKPKENAKAENK